MFKRSYHVIGIIIIAIFVLIFYKSLSPYLTLEYIQLHMVQLKNYVAEHYIRSVIFYMMLYITVIICSIPGSSIFMISAGLLFNVIPGLLYAMCAATLGSTISFLIFRYSLGNWVQRNYAQKLDGFNQEISQYGFHYLLLVRLLALLPFGLVNMLSGLTILSLKTFFLVTFVGLFPTAIMYTYAGSRFANMQYPAQFTLDLGTAFFCIFITFKVALMPYAFAIFKRIYRKIKKRGFPIFFVSRFQKNDSTSNLMHSRDV